MGRSLPALALAFAFAMTLAACGPPPLTQDRMTLEQRQALVAAPLRKAKGGDVAGAQRAFEVLLARSDPGKSSDLLTAFGIGLYMLDARSDEEERRYRRASLHYLERAIPAARSRFGASHPEVAVALSDYGEVLRLTSPDDPPRAVDRALAQSYLIRTHRLGPDNRETIAALRALAEVRGLPSRTGGDPGQVDEVGRMFEDVIRAYEARPDPTGLSPEQVRSRQLQMFVRNGRIAKALEVARSADARAGERCEVGPNRWALAEALVRAGKKPAARAVVRTSSPQPPECGLDGAFLDLEP